MNILDFIVLLFFLYWFSLTIILWQFYVFFVSDFKDYELPLHVSISVSAGCALLVAVLVWFILVPKLKKENETETKALLGQEEKAPPIGDTHGKNLMLGVTFANVECL